MNEIQKPKRWNIRDKKKGKKKGKAELKKMKLCYG